MESNLPGVDNRISYPRLVNLAHTVALREDEARRKMRVLVEANKELIEEFIAAASVDPHYAVELAGYANRILRKRQSFAEKKEG